MSNYLAFDIETGPTKNALSYFSRSDVNLGVLKDPVKIEAKIAKAEDEFLDKAAISPFTGKVLAVGLTDGAVHEVLTYESEKEIITETLERIGSQLMQQRPVVGWNIIEFDFPFLYNRAMMLGVSWPSHLWDLKKGYPHSQIIDLMRYWNMGSWKKMTKMDTVNRFLCGFGKPSGVTGADFARLFNGTPEEREKAIDYALNDVKILDSLTRKMLNF
jgi:predicted PolB exonuclease-like 3'-5' exonuclease